MDFEQDVLPIFRDNCLRCHRPGLNEGDVSLHDSQSLTEFGFVEKGDAEESMLIDFVTSHDGEPAYMPKESQSLSSGQIDVLRRWINEGADWPADVVIKAKPKGGADWWCFQPVAPVKRVEGQSISDVIDDIIKRSLDESGLKQNQPATKRELIRRVTFDLIGLPPTPDEVEQFCDDDSADAYEKLIDRLLASPHYGERWGRHWLDVVRFGESIGFERNTIIDNLWRFRDYIIASFNEDKPFDRLIQEHLAGDVIAPNDESALIGSAFLVAGPYDNVNNQDLAQKAQIRANTLDEMIRATSESFLGLT
ncbi:MAG: DUF1549 domain-containing protein, partial [Planctomycetota bacterium]